MVKAFKDFRTYSVLVAANSEVVIDATGTYFAALSATGAFELGLDEIPSTPWQSGLTVTLVADEQFSKVRIVNPGGAAITVEFNVGFGDFRDARLVLPSGLTLSKATDLENIADVAVGAAATAQLAAANTARRELLISNPVTAGGAIRVGRTGGVGAGSGALIEPGASLVLTTSARVDCHNPTAAAVSVALVGVLD